MALPPVLLPNTLLTQPYLNALRETARRGNVQVAGAGLSALDTPGGMVVQQNPASEAMENCRRMFYAGAVTGGTLLPGSLVHLLDASDANGIPSFDVADYSGRQRLGVLIEGAAPGGCPWVQYQGTALVLCGPSPNNAEQLQNAQMTRRLGVAAECPWAVLDLAGPLYTSGQRFAIPSWWGSYPSVTNGSGVQAGLALVTACLEGRRLGEVIACVTALGDALGTTSSGPGPGGTRPVVSYPANSWIFGPEYTVNSAATAGSLPEYVPSDASGESVYSGDVWVVGP